MTDLEIALVASAERSAPADLIHSRLAERYGRDALLRRMLAAADVAAIVASSLLLLAWTSSPRPALILIVSAPVWIVMAKLVGLYDRDQRTLRHLTVDELPWIVVWVLVSRTLLTILLLPFPTLDLGSADRLRVGACAVGFAFAFRAVARALWRRLTPPQRVLIVGDGPLADAVVRKFELFPDIHARITGWLPSSDLLAASFHEIDGADRVVVACRELSEELLAELVPACRRRGVKLTVVPPMRGMLGTATQLGHVADLPVLDYNTWDISRVTLGAKRIFDVSCATFALLVTLPLLPLAALAILLDGGRPILFRQQRAGRGGRPFTMLKFRTMERDAEAMLADLVPLEHLSDPMFKLRRDPRVTRVGRVLRRFSLDELPQFINVLRGEMSIVGPRPEQLDLVERYEPDHLIRLTLKPGVTGPMQVYGRGELRFDERLAVEREYVENLSLARDLRILLMTIPAVFGRRGAY